MGKLHSNKVETVSCINSPVKHNTIDEYIAAFSEEMQAIMNELRRVRKIR